MTGTWMLATVVRETGERGGWNELVFEKVPLPSMRADEVLVQVEACSVNRADLLQRRGLYPPPPGTSPVLGLDFAGFIIGSAPDVEKWHAGDRVFGVVPGGGYGRYVAVPASHCVAIPENLSFIEAAAAAEVFFTAYLNLFMEADLKFGDILLIHVGGSGVGTAAIQLAKWAKAPVIVTAGSQEKIERCLNLGAMAGINYKDEDFGPRVMEITKGKGVDVILDWVGGPYLRKHIDIARDRGRIVLIGLMGGNRTEIDLAPFLTKRLRLVGSVLRTRSLEEKADLVRSFSERIGPLLKSGEVRPIVDRIFPIRAAEEAHQYMREGRHFGKIVLTWQEERL